MRASSHVYGVRLDSIVVVVLAVYLSAVAVAGCATEMAVTLVVWWSVLCISAFAYALRAICGIFNGDSYIVWQIVNIIYAPKHMLTKHPERTERSLSLCVDICLITHCILYYCYIEHMCCSLTQQSLFK